jgi:hypothetical protein
MCFQLNCVRKRKSRKEGGNSSKRARRSSASYICDGNEESEEVDNVLHRKVKQKSKHCGATVHLNEEGYHETAGNIYVPVVFVVVV